MGKSFDCRHCHECGSGSRGFRKSHGKRYSKRKKLSESRRDRWGIPHAWNPASRLQKETRLSVTFPILKTRLGISTELPFCSRWETGSSGKARCKNVGLHQRTMTDGCLGVGLHPVVQFHVPVQILWGWGSLWH